MAWVNVAGVAGDPELKATLKLSIVKYALPESALALNLIMTFDGFDAEAIKDLMSAV
jgi:hypothetical protein